MDVAIVELFIGLLFLGKAITITKLPAPQGFNVSTDIWKLVYGIILAALGIAHGLRFI